MLKEKIAESKLTKVSIASAVGCSRQYLDKLINNQVNNPSVRIVSRLAKVLNTDVGLLLKYFTNKKTTINRPPRQNVDSGLND